MYTDNTTAEGIANDTVKQRRSKAFDMRFYWVRDRSSPDSEQKEFDIRWSPGSTNLADYHTKHHDAAHHEAMRPYFLHSDDRPMYKTLPTMGTANAVLQGCTGTTLAQHWHSQAMSALAGRLLQAKPVSGSPEAGRLTVASQPAMTVGGQSPDNGFYRHFGGVP